MLLGSQRSPIRASLTCFGEVLKESRLHGELVKVRVQQGMDPHGMTWHFLPLCHHRTATQTEAECNLRSKSGKPARTANGKGLSERVVTCGALGHLGAVTRCSGGGKSLF
jgi:hypothetical protein